jgi:NADH:ubiquinone oxidoreductase subunit 5 (subunit L)/multisubunit Na+/H+ antiporter MnhA subunit
MAMEGPTPVSSLLHSSTIVVAGVYLFSLVNISVVVLAFVALLVMLNRNLVDVKKIVAYSTSVNLVLMLLMSSLGIWGLVLIHIFVHSWFKAGMFVYSGSIIHSVGGQNLTSTFIVIRFLFLIGFSGICVSISKEMLCSVLGLLILFPT